MARLQKGLFIRNGVYYHRDRRGGHDKWISLGRDRDIANRKLREYRSGKSPVGSRVTVAAVADRWLETYVPTARPSLKGQRLAEVRVDKYLRPFLGHRPFIELQKSDTRSYAGWLRRQGISDQTVNHVLSDWRCICNWAVEEEEIADKNPFPRKVMLEVQEFSIQRLTEGQAEILCALPDPYGWVARFALATGLRWGELCRVQRGDIKGDSLTVQRTKTKRIRYIPLPESILQELQARPQVGKLIPFAESASGSYAREACKRCGFRFHPHQFRHTFACRWLDAGGSIVALQKVLGHSTVKTTERYARMSDSVVREEARKVHGS